MPATTTPHTHLLPLSVPRTREQPDDTGTRTRPAPATHPEPIPRTTVAARTSLDPITAPTRPRTPSRPHSAPSPPALASTRSPPRHGRAPLTEYTRLRRCPPEPRPPSALPWQRKPN